MGQQSPDRRQLPTGNRYHCSVESDISLQLSDQEGVRLTMPQSSSPAIRRYDIIGFGDEVPGILALVAAVRDYHRRTKRYPKTLLMLKGNAHLGIGGHLVRGGLAYLDRSCIPLDVRRSLQLETFGDPAILYKEFLQKAGVDKVGLDPQKADAALRTMLKSSGIDVLSHCEIASVSLNGSTLTSIHLTNGDIYQANQFVDSTVNAELAQAAGIRKQKGFGMMGLPDSELSVTLIFETVGLSVQALKALELNYLERLSDASDAEAQRWLAIAAGKYPARAHDWLHQFRDRQTNFRTMVVGSDYIDVRTKALSIAYHGARGTSLALDESGAILDNGNIAILPGGRLSWNALLFDVNADQAETLARNKAKPTLAMLNEFARVAQWFKALGATSVEPASELYIRHAGNVIDAVQPLSGAQMLAGGVHYRDAFGTFGYHFDIRGGIRGLEGRATSKGVKCIDHMQPPLFNIGMQHALMQTVRNLAVISPASGFKGYACSAGRIVEFNSAVGQGIGIAIAIALTHNRNLADISNKEVRAVLEETKVLPRVYGKAQSTEAKQLDQFERCIA